MKGGVACDENMQICQSDDDWFDGHGRCCICRRAGRLRVCKYHESSTGTCPANVPDDTANVSNVSDGTADVSNGAANISDSAAVSANAANVPTGAAVFGVSKTTGGDGILHALDCWTLGTSARDGAWPLGISPGLDSRISDDPLSVGSGILADHRVEHSA